MFDRRGRRARRLLVLTALVAPALLAAPARALPLLSEVFYDAVGADDGLLFVEIFAAAGSDLSGLRLEGVNGSGGAIGPVVTLSGVVPEDGLFVVADAMAGGGSAVAGADLVANFDFQNGPDSVVLRSDTTIFDALGYGSFGVGDVFAGEGAAAPDPPAGQSLARRFANLDSDDNASDFVVLETPTPGAAPLASVPEPGAAALIWLGLMLLAPLRRR